MKIYWTMLIYVIEPLTIGLVFVYCWAIIGATLLLRKPVAMANIVIAVINPGNPTPELMEYGILLPTRINRPQMYIMQPTNIVLYFPQN